jgi:hypothetical protein
MTLVAVEPPHKLDENRAKANSAHRGECVFYRRALTICLFLATGVALAAARDLALVSNKSNALTAITLADLVKICKAQTNRWPDGKPVTFIMRAPAAPEMKLFLEKVYELPGAQVKELVHTSRHPRRGFRRRPGQQGRIHSGRGWRRRCLRHQQQRLSGQARRQAAARAGILAARQLAPSTAAELGPHRLHES